jgi:hypothetical protein
MMPVLFGLFRRDLFDLLRNHEKNLPVPRLLSLN